MATNSGLMTIPGYAKPLGYAQLTSVAAATALPSVPAHTRMVLIQPESQNIRWRDDGTNPTAAIGMIIVANDMLMYTGDTSTFKLIEVTGSAKVNITYYE